MKIWLSLAVFAIAVAAYPTPVEHNGMTLVPTPFGWRPKQCVFQWPSGTHIKALENSTQVTLPTGKVIHLPLLEECLRWDYDVPSVPSTFQDRKATTPGRSSVRDGWLDNTYYFTDQGSSSKKDTYVAKFSGYYTVPDTPKDNGGLLYYFLGTENTDGSSSLGLTILQPVLTYYGKWYMNSWNCCPQGQSHESSTLKGFGPGDKVYGSMHETGSELTGDWDVVSTYNGQSVKLSIGDAYRTFDWIDATLETYYVGSDCSKLTSGPLTYSQMALTTQKNGATQPTTIQWSGDETSDCNGKLTVQSPTRVTIQHN